MSRCLSAAAARCRGLTLVELLAALAVLSIALCALIQTQLVAARTVQEAAQRELALALARDVTERIESNPELVGSYLFTGGGDPPGTPPVDCDRLPCSPQQLASYDLWQWWSRLQGGSESREGRASGGLLAPLACITHDGGWLTVTVGWSARVESGSGPEIPCAGSSPAAAGGLQFVQIAAYLPTASG